MDMGVFVFVIGLVVFVFLVGFSFGWLIPLVIGLVKMSRKSGGKGWLMAACVWAVTAFVVVGVGIYSAVAAHRQYATEEFKAETYAGDLATLVLPYSGSGELSFSQVEQKKSWQVSFVETNCVVVPTGVLRVGYLSYTFRNKANEMTGGMGCSLASSLDMVVKAGDELTLHGGAPITAAVTAKRADGDKIKINYSLTDVAGNRITYWTLNSNNKGPKFEAIGPDGSCFWSDHLEYG
jgi:hypothetical protein